MTFLLKKSSDEVVMTLKELGISGDFFDFIPKQSKKKEKFLWLAILTSPTGKRNCGAFFFAPLNFL